MRNFLKRYDESFNSLFNESLFQNVNLDNERAVRDVYLRADLSSYEQLVAYQDMLASENSGSTQEDSGTRFLKIGLPILLGTALLLTPFFVFCFCLKKKRDENGKEKYVCRKRYLKCRCWCKKNYQVKQVKPNASAYSKATQRSIIATDAN